ncbi:hypothetical protein K438DRAFT_1789272 [Mycena galopus ATCC 62051]|nr:hypothetical protein K438DRAFT_1789272 [Mycena galopus ATCC 62051]
MALKVSGGSCAKWSCKASQGLERVPPEIIKIVLLLFKYEKYSREYSTTHVWMCKIPKDMTRVMYLARATGPTLQRSPAAPPSSTPLANLEITPVRAPERKVSVPLEFLSRLPKPHVKLLRLETPCVVEQFETAYKPSQGLKRSQAVASNLGKELRPLSLCLLPKWKGLRKGFSIEPRQLSPCTSGHSHQHGTEHAVSTCRLKAHRNGHGRPDMRHLRPAKNGRRRQEGRRDTELDVPIGVVVFKKALNSGVEIINIQFMCAVEKAKQRARWSGSGVRWGRGAEKEGG